DVDPGTAASGHAAALDHTGSGRTDLDDVIAGRECAIIDTTGGSREPATDLDPAAGTSGAVDGSGPHAADAARYRAHSPRRAAASVGTAVRDQAHRRPAPGRRPARTRCPAVPKPGDVPRGHVDRVLHHH